MFNTILVSGVHCNDSIFVYTVDPVYTGSYIGASGLVEDEKYECTYLFCTLFTKVLKEAYPERASLKHEMRLIQKCKPYKINKQNVAYTVNEIYSGLKKKKGNSGSKIPFLVF